MGSGASKPSFDACKSVVTVDMNSGQLVPIAGYSGVGASRRTRRKASQKRRKLRKTRRGN